MPAAAPGAGGAMTELLRRAPDSNAPLAQECFKLLAALLRSCTSYKVVWNALLAQWHGPLWPLGM